MNNNKGITIKELLLVIWDGKWTILISTAIALILAVSGGLIYDSRSSSVATIVTFQWDGVGKGEYPDGSRFDYSTAIQPQIYTLALEEVGLDLVANDVRLATKFTPIIPDSVLEQIQSAIQNGEELTYYATNYKVVLNNGSLGISVDEGKELINEIINQFRIDFEKKYVYSVQVLDFTNVDYDALDYIDSYNILLAQTDAIDSLMIVRSEVEFISPTLGISFNDVLVQTTLLRQIELTQIITRTNNYLLTKDKDYLIDNYKYKIEISQLELDMITDQETEIQLLVDNYAGTTQTILIPGIEFSNGTEFEVDSYYNTLIEELLSLKNSKAEISNDIDYYNVLIDRLEGNDPNFLISPADQGEEIVKVNNSITVADAKLATIVDDANVLLSEYNEYKSSNIIKPFSAPQYQSDINLLLVSAISIIIGAGAGGLIVLFKNDWEKKVG